MGRHKKEDERETREIGPQGDMRKRTRGRYEKENEREP
jgi:hypothetical protein